VNDIVDRILIDPALDGQTLILDPFYGELGTDRNVAIDASALPAGFTISAAGESRLFFVDIDAALELVGLTLTQGDSGSAPGGAIDNRGDLHLREVTITESQSDDARGGGIYGSSSSFTLLESCTLANNHASEGGGVFSHGSVEVRASLMTENTSINGGALGFGGTSARIFDSTLVDNTATGQGGAVFFYTDGFEIRFSTIAHNHSDDSGGGIYVDGEMTLSNTILAFNTTGEEGPDVYEGNFADITVEGPNLLTDLAGTTAFEGTPVIVADPKLAPFAFYGGPTRSLPPLASSPVIDAGDPGAFVPGDFDQRGFARLADGDGAGGAAYDLGAVESGPAFIVSDPGSNAGDPTTLPGAFAAITEPGSVIRFDPAVFDSASAPTITPGTELSVSGAARFVDASDLSHPVAISGANAHRHFSVAGDGILALHNLILENGQAPDGADNASTPGESGGDGGSIFNAGALVITGSTLRDNRAGDGGFGQNTGGFGGRGGALYHGGDQVIVHASALLNNRAGDGGSGINPDTGVQIASPGGHGGAIYHAGKELELHNTTIFSNTAGNSRNVAAFAAPGGSGGGIYATNRPLRLIGVTVAGNQPGLAGSAPFPSVDGNGGGLYLTGQLFLQGSVVANNTTTNAGPDIFQSSTGVAFTSDGDNFVGDLTDAGSFNGTAPMTGDPLLGPLADNGGTSLSLMPQLGSPLIDPAGTTALLTVDQRSYGRYEAPDLGAIESDFRLVTTKANDGPGSLRAAIASAQPVALISFDPTVFTGGVNNRIFLEADARITTNHQTIEIDGSSVGGVTIDGQRHSGIFNFGRSTVALKQLSLTGGLASEGGAIFSRLSRLTLEEVTLSDNEAQETGGGISSFVGQLTVRRSTISDNQGRFGGGIFVFSGTATIERSTIHGNLGVLGGGGLYLSEGDVTILHSTITGNLDETGSAGGILLQNGFGPSPCQLTATIVRDNLGHDIFNEFDPLISEIGFTSGGGNLIGTGNATDLARFDEPLDQVGEDTPVGLSPLGWYGGPTQTRHPLANSPAIDAAGMPSAGATDQRGFDASSGLADTGAVEVGPVILVDERGDDISDRGTNLRTALAAATTPGSVVRFNPRRFPSSINLREGELAIPSSEGLFLDASNLPEPVTIDGGGDSRLLNIGADATVALQHFVLQDGQAPNGADSDVSPGRGEDGGGIYNAGTLTLTDSTLAFNRAGDGGDGPEGFAGDGGRGGGLFSVGRAILHRSSVIENQSGNGGFGDTADGHGGGIYAEGMLEIHSSTIANNRIPEGGVGTGDGGGLAISAIAWIEQSTIAFNSSDGDGGGIRYASSVPLRVENSVIANNTTALDGPDLYAANSSIKMFLAGENFIGDLAGGGTFEGNTPPMTIDTDGDPLLAPLGAVGGPTETIVPLPGSPLRDRAVGSVALVDQRGFPRGGAPDLGAVETSTMMVNTLVDESDGVGVGDVSLREALTTVSDEGVVLFDPNVFPGTIALSSEIVVDRPVTIFGYDRGVTISGGGATRLFRFNNPVDIVLESLHLTNGTATGDGGAIFVNSAFVDLHRVSLTENSAARGGAILLVDDGSITLEDCLLAHNTAAELGGGIMNFGGTITIENSTLAHNTASGGGAIWNQGGAILLRHATVTANTADFALILLDQPTTLENSIVTNNSRGAYFHSGTPTFVGANLFTGDPVLAPLGDYGGPTASMPPLPGSPALESGIQNTDTPLYDQRGFGRPYGYAPEIGAVEAIPFGELGYPSEDGDTIPDILEGSGAPYPMLDPTADDTFADSDGDGSPDVEELENLTNLLDLNDHLQILSIVRVPGLDSVYDVTVDTVPGMTYSLEADALLSGVFSGVTSSFVATDFTHTFRVTLPNFDHLRAKRH
jgi:fibronectin-binding autotransporter adhesin